MENLLYDYWCHENFLAHQRSKMKECEDSLITTARTMVSTLAKRLGYKNIKKPGWPKPI